jgi:hypothetical protein
MRLGLLSRIRPSALAKPTSSYTLFSRRGTVYHLKSLRIAIGKLSLLPGRGLTIRVGAARVRTPRLWLTHEYSYRVRDGYVEILGGFRLRVVSWDRRYDDYPNGDATAQRR